VKVQEKNNHDSSVSCCI